MTWLQDWRDAAADRALLRGWRRAGAFDADAGAAARAHAVLGGDPAPAQWAAFLDRVALWLGVALCAAGAICFVAANWDALGKFAKLAGLQALLAAMVVAALRAGLQRPLGRALLWLSMLLLGGLLALVGQIYPTGTDPWALFALWAALSLPWVLAARHPALWLTWAALLHAAAWDWIPLHLDPGGASDLLLAAGIGLFDALMLAAWTLAGLRWPEFRLRGGRWLLTAAAAAMLSLAAILAVTDAGRDALPVRAASAGAWLLTSAVAMALCLRGARDLPALAIWMLGVIAVSAAALHRLFGPTAGAIAYLTVGGAVVVMATGAAFVLRRCAATEPA